MSSPNKAKAIISLTHLTMALLGLATTHSSVFASRNSWSIALEMRSPVRAKSEGRAGLM